MRCGLKGIAVLLSLICLVLHVSVRLGSCYSSCSLKIMNGTKVIDVSPIGSETYIVKGTSDPNWTFYLAICGGVKNPNEATCKIHAQSYQYSPIYNLCNPIGGATYPQKSLIQTDESIGVRIAYPGVANADGVVRKLEISLICDSEATSNNPTFNFTGEFRDSPSVISYKFNGKSKVACPVLIPEATTSGGIHPVATTSRGIQPVATTSGGIQPVVRTSEGVQVFDTFIALMIVIAFTYLVL